MRPRLSIGAAAFGVVVCLSYIALRLLSIGEEGSLVSVHIPFFWRVALAVLHGVVAALVASSAVRDESWWLERVPVMVGVLVPLCIAVAVVFP